LRRRVFVSYKRKSETGVTGDSESLADDVEKGLVADYDVFRDKKSIPVGDEWHREIDRGLHLAHAAVVLLTESALQSQWVQYELAVLSFRARNSKLRLLVALLGVDPAALQKPPFTAMALAGLQLYVKRRAADVDAGRNEYDDEPGLCAKLIAELQAELPAEQSNIDRLLDDVVAALKSYAWVCDDMEKQLQLKDAVDEEQRVRRLAEELLRLRLRDFYALFDVLSARKDVPRERLFTVLELIFQFWVSGLVATELAQITDPAQRGIPLLRSADKWTAAQVVRRAEELPRFWTVIDARLPGGEKDVDAAVRQALKDMLKILPKDERDALSSIPAREVVAELDEVIGLRVWFVLVSSVEAAEALLALERTWIRPIVFTTTPPTPVDARLKELPLEEARETAARKTYKRIVHRIENPPEPEGQET
jgi:hypothetical protein